MNYLEWNDHIAAHFFHEEMSGRRVFLSVSTEVLDEIGKPYGVDHQDFLRAVRVGPPWVASQQNIIRKANASFISWRERGLAYPPFIGYLAAFVLAADGLDGFASQAFYSPLEKLLNESVDRKAFEDTHFLWTTLQKWSRTDKEGDWGIFRSDLPAGSVFVNVGLPRLQTLFLAAERRHLPQFFADNHFTATSFPSNARLLHLLQNAAFLRPSTRHILKDRTGQTNQNLAEALVNFVLDELRVWDGFAEDDSETQKISRGRQATAILRLCLKVSSLGGRLEVHCRFQSSRPFPDDELHLQEKNNVWLCPELQSGWSWPLFQQDGNKRNFLDATKLNWTQPHKFADKELGWRITLPPADLRLFFSGKREGLPDTWVEAFRLISGMPFCVACQQEARPEIEAWGAAHCDEFRELRALGLPTGWSLFEAKNARGSLPQFDALNLPQHSRLRLSPMGGIKAEGRNAFFQFAPPRILVEGGNGTEKVKCAQATLAPNEDNSWTFVPHDPTETHLFFECADERLKITLRPSGLRDAYSTFSVPDYLPELPCPPNIPTYFGGHIVFLGRFAGQIADWPHDLLPTEWLPMWAVVKVKRDVWRAHFIGDITNFSIKQSRQIHWKEWREIFRRKTTDPVGVPQVKAFWKQCRQEADQL